MVEIYFADEKVKKNFEKLRMNEEFKDLYRFICRAMEDIKAKPDCGIAISKKLIFAQIWLYHNMLHLKLLLPLGLHCVMPGRG